MSLICACCCVGVPINMLTRYVTFLFVFMFFRRAVVEWVRNFDCHTTGSGIPRRRGPNIGEKAAKPPQLPPPKQKNWRATYARQPIDPQRVTKSTNATSHAPRPTAYAAPLLTREKTRPKPL